jgi:HK97 family phage prohead protease
MTEETPETSMADVTRANDFYARSWALDGIEVLRAKDGHGDGRTVKAYATPFDVPTEITDAHGHYMEVIDRAAFNRQIGLGTDHVQVYYNHGATINGTSGDLLSVPIGSPVEIKPDGKGLLTVTRYNNSALAESVLEAIRHGDIRGYSFRGRIYKSTPNRVPRAKSGQLPTVRRMELGLTEYGPTPNPAYLDAGIVAVRALQQMLTAATSGVALNQEEGQEATPNPGPGAEDQRDAHSVRLRRLAFKQAVRERGIR